MKKQKFNKKLVLNKETIASLNNQEMNGILAGSGASCVTCATCPASCNTCPSCPPCLTYTCTVDPCHQPTLNEHTCACK